MPLTVPKQEVTMKIATDSLRRLPDGATYSRRNGRASVEVGRMSATVSEPEYIYVYAACDSLQILCERYERRIASLYGELQKSVTSAEVSEKPPNDILTSLKWLLTGIVTGAVGTILIFIKLKK